jgi:molecular chaperone DnaK
VPGDLIGRRSNRAIAELETAMKGDDKGADRAKAKALEEASQSLRAAAAAAGRPGAGGGDAGQAGAGDDVVDAEFTEVKDDNKPARLIALKRET